MGVADGVEAERGPLDDRIDPRLLAVGTGEQHLLKGQVAGDGKSAGTDALGQRTGQVESIERNDGAAARLDPEDVAGVAAVGHGEYAGGISPQ
jgi:hypothetical protein